MTSLQVPFFLRSSVKHYEVKGSVMLDSSGPSGSGSMSRWRHNFTFGVLTTEIETACKLVREHVSAKEGHRNPADIQINQVNQRSQNTLLLVDPVAIRDVLPTDGMDSITS